MLFQAVLLVCVRRAFAVFCRTAEQMLVFAVHLSAGAVQSPSLRRLAASDVHLQIGKDLGVLGTQHAFPEPASVLTSNFTSLCRDVDAAPDEDRAHFVMRVRVLWGCVEVKKGTFCF